MCLGCVPETLEGQRLDCYAYIMRRHVQVNKGLSICSRKVNRSMLGTITYAAMRRRVLTSKA